MKHKRIDQIHPYTYFVKHLPTGIKYYGVRWRNVTLGIAPVNDLGIKYFTSIKSANFKWFRESFQSNQSEFEYRIHYTFDTKEEAIAYELAITKKTFLKPDWANMNAGKAINLSKKTEEERLAMARKTSLGMLGKNTGPRPEWVKQKMRDNHADFSKENHPQYGTKQSAERKERISQGLKRYYLKNPEAKTGGEKNPMYGKHPTYIATSPSGVAYTITEGICNWCKDRGLSPSAVRKCALGIQHQTQGWKFHFAEQD